MIESFDPHWIGFNLYTGLTDHVFEWIQRYKLRNSQDVFRKPFASFDEADQALKGAVRESNGPIYHGKRLIYAPIIVGGHYNNYDYKTSWDRGAEYSVRGKGINLFKDIMMGQYPPGQF